jgi:hypothetical protein
MVVLAALAKTLVFRPAAAVAAHHGEAADGLGGDTRDIAHRVLDATAVFLELARGDGNDAADQGGEQQEYQGQLPVQVENVGEQGDHGQSLADDHLDRRRCGSGDLLDVEVDQGQQFRRVALGEIGHGQAVDVREDAETQLVDHASGDVGDVVAAEVRADTAQGHDHDDGQGQEVAHPFSARRDRSASSQAASSREAAASRPATAPVLKRCRQVLHEARECGLRESVEREAEQRHGKRRPQGTQVGEQAQVGSQTGRRMCCFGGCRGAFAQGIRTGGGSTRIVREGLCPGIRVGASMGVRPRS